MGYLWCWKSFPTQCTIGLDLMTSCMTSNPKVSSFRINFYVIRSSINKNFLQKQKKWFSLYNWWQNMHVFLICLCICSFILYHIVRYGKMKSCLFKCEQSSQETERSYIYVLGILISPFSTIFLLIFGIILTVL